MNAYTFRIEQPEARRAEVELQVESRGAETLDVRLPVWTPGSYLVREHQRHVDGLRAEGDGRELQVDKVDKQTWRVRTSGARAIRIWYRLHCFELTVRTNHVDGTHAFLNPSATAAFVVGRESETCSVRLQLPRGWRAWVALPFEDGVYVAQDYDELADSPFECGPEVSHAVHTFAARGVRHELVVWGRGDFDGHRGVRDLGGADHPAPADAGTPPHLAVAGVVRRLDQALPARREHRQHHGLVLPEGQHRRVPARPGAAASQRRGEVARRPGALAVREARPPARPPRGRGGEGRDRADRGSLDARVVPARDPLDAGVAARGGARGRGAQGGPGALRRRRRQGRRRGGSGRCARA